MSYARLQTDHITQYHVPLKRVKSDVTELNRTDMVQFWRTDQWASRASLLVIGWCVRARSHVGRRRR